MKNRKGFTLVELLVTVLILGIVTGLSIPLIRNVQNNNKNREYIAYMDTMKYSAKLYVDSYGEDLFGKRKTGCTIIKYSDLYGKGLLKDIPVDKVSCASDDSFVKVVKLDDKYGYSTAIGCGYVDAGGNVIINTNISNTGNIVTKTCNLEAKVIMDFQAVPEESLSVKYKKRNIKLTISSDTGFNDDMQIYYGFSYNQDSNVIDNNWRKLPIKASGKRSQKEKILSGEAISITTDDLTTPAGVTGKLYLVIRVDKLENLANESWTRDKDIESFQYFGPYIVDNTKPEFNDSTIISSEATYNSVKPKLNLKVTDNLSKSEDLKMCISYDNDSCSKKVSDMKNGVGYEDYRADMVLNPIKNVHDGSNHTIFVTVADKAGNYTTVSYTYTLAITLTYNPNGGNGTMPPTYCNKGTVCTLSANKFTRGKDYEYLGFFDAQKDGNKYGDTAIFNASSTIYAQWKMLYSISFHYTGSFKVASNGTVYTDADYQTLEKNYKVWFLTSGTLTTYVDSDIDVFLAAGGTSGSTYYGGTGGGVAYTTSAIHDNGVYNIVIGGSNQNTVAFDQTALTGHGAGGSHRVGIYSGAECSAGNYGVYYGYGWGGIGKYAWNDSTIDGVRYGCGGTGGASCCGMTCCGTTCNGAGGAFPSGCGGGNGPWSGANGIPNTGGGGGGASWWGNGGHSGGAGGSGVVIIRKKEN